MFETPAVTAMSSLRRQVSGLGGELGAVRLAEATDAELVGLLSELEVLKCRVEAAQVLTAAALDVKQRSAQAAAGVPLARQGQGVALQVALARRESHHRGQQHLGLARVLTRELPCTLKALQDGLISEWRATVVARETACVSAAHRAEIDQQLGAAPDAFSRWGERELIGELRRMTYRLDPASVVARRRYAETQRSVSLRPAPDCMTYLSALLPVATGVAVYAELRRAADGARAGGDDRAAGQMMADTLAGRVLGQPDGSVPRVPVTVNVVVSDEALLTGTGDGAVVQGYGVVPAGLARQLAATGPGVQLRRLYASPATGALVAMDSRSRCFPAGLAELVRLRDRTCRTPWCDAPVRHIDHVRGHAAGGPTSAENAQGLCEACNHAKAAPGWAATTGSAAGAPAGAGHTVTLTTPTGATYDSTAPPAPRPLPWRKPGRQPTRTDASWAERSLEVRLADAA